ncbi:olfactory receptor 10A7-like [Thamnophis elegans]|uniref:olfactory receptor 10A7-like n=1 Tax=Thamnophis elegans TaxID=35005 RepID=UPI0013771E33|nr:olfactory receptor 10A7-like [Thamnophis elegans]
MFRMELCKPTKTPIGQESSHDAVKSPVFDKDPEELQRLIKELHKAGESIGLKINLKKSQNYSTFHQQEQNQSTTTEFILLGFGNLLELRIILFILFLPVYTLSIAGNLLIVSLVVTDQHLHTSMYFFLVNLSCLETCYISTILPRMLASFISGDQSISVYGCIIQYYFFGFFAATECYLLAMMSYDRYVAICKPLHYTILMNGRLCLQLALTSWMSGLLTNTIITSFLLELTFCGPNEVDHFFCDIYPVANISCSNTHLVKLATFILGIMGTGPPFLITVASYICILHNVLQINSKTAQQKAFSTCSSHLIVVTLFYGSIFLVYIVPEMETLKELHKIFSIFYTVLTPMLNPLIYSLRNREVKEALFRVIRKCGNKIS